MEETRANERATGDPAAICDAIIRMAHLIERFANGRLPAFGVPASLSMARARLLTTLHDAGAMRMSDLAWELGITSRTITSMVDALEDAGLLSRHPDPTDRRAILLALTEDGTARLELIHHALNEIGALVLSPLSERERMALDEMLTRLTEREG
jgi:DNA-binding MarR family transcriptional regulator